MHGEYSMNNVLKWAFFSTIVSSFSHLVLRVALGNSLGPGGLGIYTLIFTFYLFGLSFSGFGIGAAIRKNIAENHHNQSIVNEYISNGLILSVITGLIVSILLWFLSPMIATSFFKIEELETYLKFVALAFPFIAIQKAVLNTLNGLKKIKMYSLITIIQNSTIVIASVIFVVFLKLGLYGATLGIVIPTIVISLLSIIAIKDNIGFVKSKSMANKNLITFGMYTMMAGSISFLNNQIDSILIGYFLHPVDLGIYAVAFLLSQAVLLFPQSIQIITTPIISNYYGEHKYTEIKEYMRSYQKKALLITAPILIFIFLFGIFIIDVLFGKSFEGAFIPCLILSVGCFAFVPWMAIGSFLSCIDKISIVYRINIIFMIINILLNVVLIPVMGVVGAALSTSLVHILNSIICIKISYYYVDRLIINRYCSESDFVTR